MTGVGTCEVMRDDDGGIRVLRADPHIRISRELITAARTPDYPHVSVDDGVFTIHAAPPVRYRLLDDGNPHDVPASLVQEDR